MERRRSRSSNSRGFFTRVLDAVQGRFRRARPGSVLIMVVSLLVLLALIGTAAMSTARLDRVSSLQHVRNTQVDILAQSVKEMIVGLLGQDLKENAYDSTIPDPDQMATPKDSIIGSSVPERLLRVLPNAPFQDPMDPNAQRPGRNEFVWTSPSYPPVRNGKFVPFKLDLPNEPTDNPKKEGEYQLLTPKPRFAPRTITLKDGKIYPALRAIDAYGNDLKSIDVTINGTTIAQPLRIGTGDFLAADADGDGIADSLLFKMPIAPVDGISYYAAARVIDNSAKINVNTAWNPALEMGHVKIKTNGDPQSWVNADVSFAGVFPASVDLEGLLDPVTKANTLDPAEPNLTEMSELTGQRVYGDRKQTAAQGHQVDGTGLFVPLMPPTSASNKSAMNPIVETYYPPAPVDTANNPTPNYKFAQMIQRPDYLFLTQGDAMYSQLGRRLDNPGVLAPRQGANPKDPASWEYWGGGVRPVAVADAIALAYRFTIMNADAHDSTIEKILFVSASNTKTTRSGRYQPMGATPQTAVNDWFRENFDYPWFVPTNPGLAGHGRPYNWPDEYPANPLPLRALLTSLNPVRNDVFRHRVTDDPATALGLQTFRFILRDGTRDTKNSFNQEVNQTLAPDGTKSFLAIPQVRPGKTNINTAPFGELWRGFFDVMAQKGPNDKTITPFDFGADDPIYQGSRFDHTDLLTFKSFYNEEHAARMFRSPLRPNGGATPGAGANDPPVNNPDVLRMHPFQVMVLRAAIAAINAQALRSDLDVKDPTDPTKYVIRDVNIPFQDILLPQVDSGFNYLGYKASGNLLNCFYPGLGATVYGVKRQPFITEVLLSNNVEKKPAADGTQTPPIAGATPFDAANDFNMSGFAAIEIHNPYDRPMHVGGWKLSLIDRRPVAPTGGGTAPTPQDADPNPNTYKVSWNTPQTPPALTMVDLPANPPGVAGGPTPSPRWYPSAGSPLATAGSTVPPYFAIPDDTYIPPHGYLVISNLLPGAPQTDLDSARYAPGDANNPGRYITGSTANDVLTTNSGADKYADGGRVAVYARFLHYVMDHEVVLQRPVMWDRNDASQPSEDMRMIRWAPVDSFDATGIQHQEFVQGTPKTTAVQWHYVRGNDTNSTATRTRAWHFVYPGRYDASLDRPDWAHHQGTEVATFNPAMQFDPWVPGPVGGPPSGAPTPIQLGLPDLRNSRDAGADNPIQVSTFPIQVANTDFTSHFDDYRLTMAKNPTQGFPANPMHGFLRAGDMLHVTFIGSYTIWNAGDWSLAPPNQGNANFIPRPPYAYDPKANPQPTERPPSGGGPLVTRLQNPQFIEVNPITMDAAMAEDTDGADDTNPFDTNDSAVAYKRPLEDIGRFAPINIKPDGQNPPPNTVPLIADVQAHSYTGTISAKDADGEGGADGLTKFVESGMTLHNTYPDDFWNGYEVLVFNQDPNEDAVSWTVQRRYIPFIKGQGFLKTVKRADGSETAQVNVDPAFPFSPKLTADKKDPNNPSGKVPRTYTFVLQRVRYGWASKLMDYFTTQQSPADDYSPNADPSIDRFTAWGGILDRARNNNEPYIPDPLPFPDPTKNVTDPAHMINRGELGSTNPMTEDDVPSEGLININTASWRVLAQLPLVMKKVPGRENEVDHLATEYLARQIVYFRDVDDGRGFDPNDPNYFDPAQRMFKPRPHGPFKSLFELLMIPEFEACRTMANGNLLPTQNPNRDGTRDQMTYDPNITDGDFSPLRDPGASFVGDRVRWDWKEKYLMINRISNLVTLKSDCYTAYIQVQGWRDAGTADATMVSQKRLAFIVDRSRVSGTQRSPTVYNVPVAE